MGARPRTTSLNGQVCELSSAGTFLRIADAGYPSQLIPVIGKALNDDDDDDGS